MNVHDCRLVAEILAAPGYVGFGVRDLNAVEVLSRGLIEVSDNREPIRALALHLVTLRPELVAELGLTATEGAPAPIKKGK